MIPVVESLFLFFSFQAPDDFVIFKNGNNTQSALLILKFLSRIIKVKCSYLAWFDQMRISVTLDKWIVVQRECYKTSDLRSCADDTF